jgi:hypothetical protein
MYRACGVDAGRDQGWVEWTLVMLAVNAVSLVVLYAMQRLQGRLPLNPNALGPVSPDSSWNTAVSFTTNTNWQGYSGESTMSHLTQMAGLALHNFLSAATGIAIAVAVIRGVARERAKGIGNFWFDCTRALLWVLLPASFAAALFLVSRGVVQNFRADVSVTTVEGAVQRIAQGPVASQEAIKELGTNGGGFFNANSAHPYENPTPGTNFFEMVLIFAIGAGLTNTLGRMTGSVRHGWAVFTAMAVLFLAARHGGRRRAGGQPDPPGGGPRGRADRAAPAATWRARRSLRDRGLDALRHGARRTRLAARSTPGTTRSRRSADSYRSRTSRRARSSSAASAPALRHVRVHRADRVHRRPDGRATRSTSARRSSPTR